MKTNEAYCSQYLDHEVFNSPECGLRYVVARTYRKVLVTLVFNLVVSALSLVYSTDGYQFFGKQFKFTGQAAALELRELPNEKYHMNLAMLLCKLRQALLSQTRQLSILSMRLWKPIVLALTGLNPLRCQRLLNCMPSLAALNLSQRWKHQPQAKAAYINGAELTEQELVDWFGDERRFAEKQGSELLSFFYGDSQYVTLAAKERYLERATGHASLHQATTKITATQS
ncbi:hypothetical protein [Vibrio taketomensis]|uniref:hypothetical protein n=1 Tax=Vibrio taketomensis TaxID=2572923 RepID=UPI001E51E887|nr:hypothetical protein [Vibrio taketomensis]